MQTDGHLCRRTIAVPGLPALLAQGRPAELGGGQLLPAAHPHTPPKRHKQTQKGPVSSSQPFFLPAPRTLTILLSQAPGPYFKSETEAKCSYCLISRV